MAKPIRPLPFALRSNAHLRSLATSKRCIVKAAILALAATGALFLSTATADAAPPHHHGGSHAHSSYYHGRYSGGYRGYNGARFYPSYNTSPYRGYYGGYYPNYYSPNNGFFLGLGRFSLGIGNGYSYPYYGGYYSSPYYWNW